MAAVPAEGSGRKSRPTVIGVGVTAIRTVTVSAVTVQAHPGVDRTFSAPPVHAAAPPVRVLPPFPIPPKPLAPVVKGRAAAVHRAVVPPVIKMIIVTVISLVIVPPRAVETGCHLAKVKALSGAVAHHLRAKLAVNHRSVLVPRGQLAHLEVKQIYLVSARIHIKLPLSLIMGRAFEHRKLQLSRLFILEFL